MMNERITPRAIGAGYPYGIYAVVTLPKLPYLRVAGTLELKSERAAMRNPVDL